RTRTRRSGEGALLSRPPRSHHVEDTVCGLAGVLVLPHANDEPARLYESEFVLPVANDGRLDLVRPPGAVRLRRRPVLRAAMPPAAVDEEGDALAGEHDIGLASEPFDWPPVDAVSEPASVKRSPDADLELSVPTPVRLHRQARRLGCGRRRRGEAGAHAAA